MLDRYKNEPEKRNAYLRGYVRGQKDTLDQLETGVPKLLIVMGNMIADGLLNNIEQGRHKNN